MQTSLKKFYKNNPWKGRFFLIIFIILLALALIRLALPQVIISGTTSWLKQQNIDASIEQIKINLFSGTVSLLNARGSKNGSPLFNVGHIEIHWYWTPLKDRTLTITQVTLDQLNINIEQYHDKIMIGGVAFPLTQAAKEKDKITSNANKTQTAKQIEPWAASLGHVIFTNLNICYLQHLSSSTNAGSNTKLLDYCIQLEKLAWTGIINYATDRKLLASSTLPLSSSGDFTLNGLTITDNKLNKNLLVSKANTLHEVTISGLDNIHIKQLKMRGFSAMQRDDDQHKDTFRFNQLTFSDIQLNDLNTLFIKDIKINDPGLYLVRYNQSYWQYQQWIPSINKNSKNTNAKTNDDQPITESSFHVALKNISIDNADLCYLDIESTFYYCYTSERLSWQGDISYSNSLNLAGDLTLSHSQIHNHSIERNLLDLGSLTFTQLNIKDLDNVSVAEIKLDNLRALQRGKEHNDTTIAFDKLVISSIQHTPDNISIDTIKLDGLANSFSKNENGKWEHNKWLTQNKKSVANNDDENKNKATTKQPFIISLNRFIVSTTNNILFTDNSTEPVMEIGLQKLDLDISNLDSAKPDNDSQFKLFAKTTRHGTINLEGSARPFSDKVSFDATGELKGFDLRALSPASKNAIGHIIKSGQLDADLTLLAKEGVLDSNLALSLHHFNIKPMSENDATALDEKFGMPLNQTLALLRDKDDSIHLNIPVTGDINNPDFNPMDAIIKATAKAATVTLITFYTPYGLIYVGAHVLFDLATAMNFAPVEFIPGSADLTNENKEQLDKLANLMSKKPQIRLILCGVTNTHDLHALFPALKIKDKDGKNAVQITNEQKIALTKLAKQRQINIKNYLIKKADVSHYRLILCAPKHQTDDAAIAGVEINI